MVVNNAIKSGVSSRKDMKQIKQCREAKRARARENSRNTRIINSENHRTTEGPKLIPVTKLMYSRARTVA